MKKSQSKKALAALLVSALALSIFACGGGGAGDSPGASVSSDASGSPGASTAPGTENPPDAPTKDTVTIAVTQDSGTLDPMIISGNDIVYAVHMIYDQLWYIDENGDEIMMLATEREKIDQLTYRVKLREDITFTNGNSFESDDVLFSLDHANKRPGQPGILPQLDVDSCKIVDPYTIDLVFSEYLTTLMQSIGGLCMLDKQTSEADPETLATRPVGTGPYILTEYVVNSHLNLTRRDEYWGTMPAIKNYSFVQLKEESQRVNAIETGEVDLADIPYQDIEYVKSLPGVRVDQTQGFMGSALYFNISSSSIFYDDPDARRAVAYAVDRDAINNLAYSGTGTKPAAPVDGTASDGDGRMFDMGIYGDDYKPELAAELAESSGLTGKTVRLINNGTSAAAMTSELIQADCKKVGITIDVISLDMGTWVSYLFDETQYDMCIDGVPLAPASYAGSYSFCYSSMAAGSYANYDFDGKEKAFADLALALSDDDVQRRVELNNEMAKISADEMLWYNLVSPSSALGMAADLKGTIRSGYNVPSLYRNLSWG
ncbi:MAG: ABC transporter substrate-binding protein [Oscillospiraceae bacterium]|jgi:peptide/nickel transport system substrate-binding protein|nr:ABC transporter substrate-binding protein [Oscillospiraceae bacterium]